MDGAALTGAVEKGSEAHGGGSTGVRPMTVFPDQSGTVSANCDRA